jgi:hypothetical protein
MLKLRSIMENVAEELFSRFLPQIDAQASCWMWEYKTVPTCHCCSVNYRRGHEVYRRWVNPCGGWYNEWQYVHTECYGDCCVWA